MRHGGIHGSPLRKSVSALVWASAILAIWGCVAFASAEAKHKPSSLRAHAFADFIASLWPMAEARGVSRATFDRAFEGVAFDPAVVAETTRQVEFAVPIWAYIGAAVSPDRIARGAAKAGEAAPWLSKTSRVYGVDPGVVMGVWGIETDYGAAAGASYVVRSLASLAFVRYRDTYFRDELLSALVILETGEIAPHKLVGSWAGATGQTQFMPSNVLAYAVDFEGHGRRDIWASEADAIGSTANYLTAHGWAPGLPWGFEVKLPPDFPLSDTDSAQPAAFASFAARGVARADGKALPAAGEGRLLMPAGLRGPIFLITQNFDVIKAYNSSTAYALAVALLGDAIMDRARVVVSWPRADPALNARQVRDLQARLKKLGYDPGEVDGMIGDALRSAVRKYQERNGLPPDGYADVALLKRIESGR
jgi:lytic murein transglycosylase